MPLWVARRPLAWLALCMAAGVAAAEWGLPAGILVGIPLWVGAFLLARRWRVLAAIAGLFAAAGFVRALTAFHPGADDISLVQRFGRVRLQGVVVSDVTASATTARFTMRVERMDPGGGDARVVSGLTLVRLRLSSGPEVPRYGDRIVAQGYLEPIQSQRNPGGFDARVSYRRQGIRTQLEVTSAADCIRLGSGAAPWALYQRMAHVARESFLTTVRRLLPAERAELLAGVVLGLQADLPPEVRGDFAATGTTHVLAASGMNVGILAAGLTLGLGLLGLGPRRAMPCATATAFFYTLAAGASPSVVRAFLMWTLFTGAHLLQREPDLINALGAAALLQLIVSPGALYDVGFQLSYAIVLALALASPGIASFLRKEQDSPQAKRWWEIPLGWLAGTLLVTLVAQLAAAPITAFHFNQVPALGIVANVLIIWTCAPLMAIGLLVWLLGSLAPSLAGHLATLCADPLLRWMQGVVHVAASMPLASIPTPSPPGWLALTLLLAVLVLVWAIARTGRADDGGRARRSLAPLLVVLAAGSAAVWWLALRQTPEQLTVTFLDVGQGDAIVVQTRNGGTMLVDCGPPGGTRGDLGQRVILPALRSMGIRRLDVLALTHADLDHIGGAVSLLRRIPVERLVVSGAPASDVAYLRTLDTARQLRVPVTEVRRGSRIRLSRAVSVEVLHPPPGRISPARSDNYNSLVLSVRCGRTAVLLMGDADADAERTLLPAMARLRADVLKLGHHGSRSSTTESLLAHVQPRYAVVSVGRRNPYGHPSQVVLDRLAKRGVQVFRTDTQGAIRVISNGANVRVEPALTVSNGNEVNR